MRWTGTGRDSRQGIRVSRVFAWVGVILLWLAPSALSVSRADVLFVFDTTGSMYGELTAASAQASSLAAELRASIPDIAFGVAELKDYPQMYGDPSDYPWKVVTPMTGDSAVFQAGVASLSATGGGDSPESYATALQMTRSDGTIGWRGATRRFVVVLGDEMPHDNDLNEGIPAGIRMFDGVWDTGTDLGPDGELGTSDDIDLQQTLAGMKADGIQILHVFFSGSSGELEYWRHWARSTGGDALASDASGLSSTVVALVQAGADHELPACPPYSRRNADNVCIPTRGVVFVSGLNSSQRFADSRTLDACPDAGTWQSMAKALKARYKDSYQFFLAPVDKRGAAGADCPGSIPKGFSAETHIRSQQDLSLDENGRRLMLFLAGLKSRYQVTEVVLVGHSQGGLWSRSALTQLSRAPSPPVKITSVVTVGTPHTGSYGADALASADVACSPANLAACAIAGAGRVFMGETRSLTGSFVQSWDRNQTRQTTWGCVPIAGIAGTALSGAGDRYRSPNDGIVGVGSALPPQSAVPGFQSVGNGEYPSLVHTAQIKSLWFWRSGLAIMTDAAETETVLAGWLNGSHPLKASCGASTTAALHANSTQASTAVTPRVRRPRRVVTSMSVAARRPGVAAGDGGDQAYVLNGPGAIMCGGRRFEGRPLMGLADVRIVYGDSCRGKAATATDNASVLTIKSKRGRVVVARTTSGISLRVTGIDAKTVRVVLRGPNGSTRKLRIGVGATKAVRLVRGRYVLTLKATGASEVFGATLRWTK